jgi:hypothetical protein
LPKSKIPNQHHRHEEHRRNGFHERELDGHAAFSISIRKTRFFHKITICLTLKNFGFQKMKYLINYDRRSVCTSAAAAEREKETNKLGILSEGENTAG